MLNDLPPSRNFLAIVTAMFRLWPYAACLITSVIATACAPLPTIKVSGPQTRRPLVLHASKAKMVDAKEVASRSCEVIGIVSAIGDPKMANPLVPCATSWRARRKMCKVAGMIGASALIDYRAGEPPPWLSHSRRSWASAIAVRFLDSPSSQNNTNRVGIVLVPRPESNDADAAIALSLASAARYYLAEKGYFPIISEQGDPMKTTRSVAKSNTPIASSAIPPAPEFVLYLRLKHREGKIPRADDGYLQGELVEKSSGAIAWSFTPDVRQGIRLVDFKNLARIHGYHAILCDLFNTLPDRTTRAFFSLKYAP